MRIPRSFPRHTPALRALLCSDSSIGAVRLSGPPRLVLPFLATGMRRPGGTRPFDAGQACRIPRTDRTLRTPRSAHDPLTAWTLRGIRSRR